MLKSRVIKFEYTRNKPSVKYVLLCQRWDKHRDLVAYDITSHCQAALREDQRNSYGDTGPELGWVIQKALKAGDAHIEVLSRWNKSRALGDRDFNTFKNWFMRNSHRSVDVYDWTKNLLEPDYDEWYFLDRVDVHKMPEVETQIDFKPKIGFEGGIWRNYKSEFINYIKEWNF